MKNLVVAARCKKCKKTCKIYTLKGAEVYCCKYEPKVKKDRAVFTDN